MSSSDPRPEKPVTPDPSRTQPRTRRPRRRAPSSSPRRSARSCSSSAVVGTALFAAELRRRRRTATRSASASSASSLAFGLTVVAGAYAWGPISGGHFNPAVTLGLAAAGRFAWKDSPGYIVAQIVGGAVATTLIVPDRPVRPRRLAAERAGRRLRQQRLRRRSPPAASASARRSSPRSLFTAIFVLVILGVTHPTRGTAALAPARDRSDADAHPPRHRSRSTTRR